MIPAIAQVPEFKSAGNKVWWLQELLFNKYFNAT